MEVEKMFPASMDKREQYKLYKSPEVEKMSDAAGSVLDIVAWMLYKDVDNRTQEDKEVLTLQTTDGEYFGTISKSFIREFLSIIEIFGDDPGMIKVISGTSRSGRNYITCTIE